MRQQARFGRQRAATPAIGRFLRRMGVCSWASCALATILAAQSPAAAPTASQQTRTSPTSPVQTKDNGAADPSPAYRPRGKKLALTDGSFQLVREYEINGDRVRYYTLDNSQWEEIPASLIDWEATKKIETEEAQRDAELAARAHLREQGRRAEPLDIDASLEVAPGVFLPPGEGLFLFDGHSIARVAQAETSTTLNKGRAIEKVLVPIPLPSRHTISVDGPHSVLRIRGSQLEFYKRSADGTIPNLQLVRGKVHSRSREFERLSEFFGERELNAKTVPIQSWEIAPGLFRFTLSKDLEPGEYAIAEIIPGDNMQIYLWDFGLDLPGEPAAAKAK